MRVMDSGRYLTERRSAYPYARFGFYGNITSAVFNRRAVACFFKVRSLYCFGTAVDVRQLLSLLIQGYLLHRA